MIKESYYEGPAYYYYSYNDMTEFGLFYIKRYTFSENMFSCKPKFIFSYNSSLVGADNGGMSSNQLHGQNIVKYKYENWYKDLDELIGEGREIVRAIFDAPKRWIDNGL